MRVAINALFLEPPMGGLETYLVELVAALSQRSGAPELTVITNPRAAKRLQREPWAASVDLVSLPRLGAPGRKAPSELALLGPLADRRGVDVIHSVAMTGPLWSHAARVVTVPDVIWLTHPGPSATHGLWRVIVPRVARRADQVIAISRAGAREVVKHLGVRQEQITTTLLGAGQPPSAGAPIAPDALRRALALGDGPLILNVGQKGVHRNLERLIAALATVRTSHPGAQLVLPGPAAPEAEARLRAAAAAHGVADAVVLPGFVDEPTLEGLYAAATAFVLPSLVEGFGLPVVEAMQRGTPVACSRESAPGEVAGAAALTFDPLDQDAIAAAISRLLGDNTLRNRLSELGRARAQSFTWSRCAEDTMTAYAAALEHRRSR